MPDEKVKLEDFATEGWTKEALDKLGKSAAIAGEQKPQEAPHPIKNGSLLKGKSGTVYTVVNYNKGKKGYFRLRGESGIFGSHKIADYEAGKFDSGKTILTYVKPTPRTPDQLAKITETAQKAVKKWQGIYTGIDKLQTPGKNPMTLEAFADKVIAENPGYNIGKVTNAIKNKAGEMAKELGKEVELKEGVEKVISTAWNEPKAEGSDKVIKETVAREKKVQSYLDKKINSYSLAKPAERTTSSLIEQSVSRVVQDLYNEGKELSAEEFNKAVRKKIKEAISPISLKDYKKNITDQDISTIKKSLFKQLNQDVFKMSIAKGQSSKIAQALDTYPDFSKEPAETKVGKKLSNKIRKDKTGKVGMRSIVEDLAEAAGLEVRERREQLSSKNPERYERLSHMMRTMTMASSHNFHGIGHGIYELLNLKTQAFGIKHEAALKEIAKKALEYGVDSGITAHEGMAEWVRQYVMNYDLIEKMPVTKEIEKFMFYVVSISKRKNSKPHSQGKLFPHTGQSPALSQHQTVLPRGGSQAIKDCMRYHHIQYCIQLVVIDQSVSARR
jgi:hypothetical protein